MSGIAGIINLDGAPVDPQLLWRMTGSMTRQGPDEQHIWIDGDVGFGHTLLHTTFEAETEKQPLTLNGEIWLTADARVDGRVELISALETKLDRDVRVPLLSSRTGPCRSPNDAELILFAYEAWGEDCVKHLIGDFAFAIWDKPKRRLFCARDHLGVRQFFYFRGTRSLVFSNSLECLRLHPFVSDNLNDDAIADFLLFGLNQNPTTTVFADIRRLPRAHSLTVSPEHQETREYWTPHAGTIRFKSDNEYLETFNDLLKSAVDDRLRASRVSISMSGGMDSSAVAATALQSLKASSAPFDLRAFCITYSGFPDRECEYAGVVAQALGIPLEFLEGDAINTEDSRGDHAYIRPEPFQIEPFYAVSKELLVRMSDHGRVALTGWDGDTIVNESPKYRYALLLKKFRLVRLATEMAHYVIWSRRPPPIGVRTSLKRLIGRYPPKPPFPVWLNPNLADRLNIAERWQRATAEPQLFYTTRPNAFRILSSPSWAALLERYDGGVTSLPLEVRHPLVDVRVVEYALNLPIIPWVIDKWILRAATKGVLPEAVRNRPKTPLAVEPALGLARSEKFKQVDEFNPTAATLAYIDRQAIPKIAAESDANKLWMNARPFVLNQWLLHSLPIDRSPVTENKNDCQIQTRKFG
jgi:asparagine synthase (glutamine-hydrolysing)